MTPDHPHARLRAALDELHDALIAALEADLEGALEWLQSLRRPPGVVLWGGRPGVDLQLGGREDLLLTRRRAAYYEFGRAMHRAVRASGVSASLAAAGMRSSLEAIARASKSVEDVQAEQAALARKLARHA